MSTNARDLLGRLLEADPVKRITAKEALRHPWLAGGKFQTVRERNKRYSRNENYRSLSFLRPSLLTLLPHSMFV